MILITRLFSMLERLANMYHFSLRLLLKSYVFFSKISKIMSCIIHIYLIISCPIRFLVCENVCLDTKIKSLRYLEAEILQNVNKIVAILKI